MLSSHTSPSQPSPLLALVCLDVVHRLRPAWVAVDLSEAAGQEGISPQRLSRLCSRAIEPFEQALALLTRIGRPPLERQADEEARELAITRALLEVATAILRQVSLRKEAVRVLVVGAFERLKAAHPGLTAARFAATLGISERTFRHWRKNVRATKDPEQLVEPGPRPAPSPRKRPPRRPRFGFDVVLAGTQEAADTTSIQAFGVGLKLMATQDIGGRDENLLDSVVVDDHESAELIARALEEALAGKEGAQLLTDQGTPYMARALEAAMDRLGIEHAPQREGEPTDKSTLERAFGTVKRIAAPVLKLTDRLARSVPRLADAEVAVATTRLVVAMLLRAYQAGARATRQACEARGGVTAKDLARTAQESRENARKQEESVRLLLGHLHELHGFAGSAQTFVNRFRRYPLTVLQTAQQAFGDQAHRDDIRDRASYFAAIVRKLNEQFQQNLAEKRVRQEEAPAEAPGGGA